MLRLRIWNEMRSQHQSVLCRSGQWSQSQIGLVKPIYQKFRAIAWSRKAVRRERWKMHQIYSCSDENLEVFTTVISSKCEYSKTVNNRYGVCCVLDGRGVSASGKSLKWAAPLLCRARCCLLEPICAGALILWLHKIFTLANLGNLEMVLMIYLWGNC